MRNHFKSYRNGMYYPINFERAKSIIEIFTRGISTSNAV